ncbi:preprotein translocase subunit YajC [Advenella sp. S44]|uniref:preprotein translocase subunit YajC n=1 Tax=Advenella sp. S44 TaxID=1982755 RepID=UPI000C2A9EAF|nr:preprotein translocase subunit YajC [Advenella sp. S44]PJX25881.1 preprotein translocase subunit YajC [Advenella sp. S44]
MLTSNLSTLVLAQAAPAGGILGSLSSFLPIILMFVVLYFLMIRPQMKRQKETKAMIDALAKGDEVITAGGILGKISKVTDNYLTIEVSNLADKPVEVLVQRVAVTTVLPKGTVKSL